MERDCLIAYGARWVYVMQNLDNFFKLLVKLNIFENEEMIVVV